MRMICTYHAFTTILYIVQYIPIRMHLSYSSRMPAGEPLPRGELVPNSLHYLFLWCLFMSHIQLAKIVWENTHVRSHVFQAPLSSSDTDMILHRAACLPCISSWPQLSEYFSIGTVYCTQNQIECFHLIGSSCFISRGCYHLKPYDEATRFP